jgi:hypothetical protein
MTRNGRRFRSGLIRNEQETYKNWTRWKVKATAPKLMITRQRLMYIRKTSRVSPEKRILTWIRTRIHPYCWGTSDRFKRGFSQTSSHQILEFFGCLRFDLPRNYLRKISNKDFMCHVTGQEIIYFQSNGRYQVPETLINIDIDSHIRGSYQGALECANWLRSNWFPELFWCRSTNGRGIHAYVVVRKTGYGEELLDHAITKLERWLHYQHHLQGWDIEKIEVKGRPPIFHWGNEKYELRDVKLGTLAKVPVEALDRPEELMATTSVSIPWLNRLGLEVPKDWESNDLYCTTYSLPISNDAFGQIDLEDFRLWQPETGSRVWCPWIEKMAKIGLVEDDSMGYVVFELSKWLVWVELFDRDDCQVFTTELLQSYILNKHNGHVSRLTDGHESEVLSQIQRIVASAEKISQDSSELFARIRESRDNGKYWRPIKVAPLLSGTRATTEVQDKDIICTNYSLPIRDDVLRPPIEEKLLRFAKMKRMRRSYGEFPFLRFSRRLLNYLYDRKGSARLSTATLTTFVSNVHQQNNFKQALRHLDLLRDWTGTYRAKSASCLYCLTDEAMRLMKNRKSAVGSERSDLVARYG